MSKPGMKRPLKGQLSEAFSRTVGDYLLIEKTEICHADLALIFGTRSITRQLAQTAAELYHAGHVPLIVASGGKTLGQDGPTEAKAIHDHLLTMDVPESAIIVEQKSQNTRQNILLSKDLLQERGELDQVKRVIGIGHITAARRFLMTLERHWPETFKMLVSTNPYPVPVQEYHLHDGFRREAMRQFTKLDYYFRKRQIAEVDIDAINQSVRAIRASDPSGPV